MNFTSTFSLVKSGFWFESCCGDNIQSKEMLRTDFFFSLVFWPRKFQSLILVDSNKSKNSIGTLDLEDFFSFFNPCFQAFFFFFPLPNR